MPSAPPWHHRLLARRDRRRAGAAWGSSLLAHLLGVGGCVLAPQAWFAMPTEYVSLAGRTGTIVLQGSWSRPVPEVTVRPPKTLPEVAEQPEVAAQPAAVQREPRLVSQPVAAAARPFDVVDTNEQASIVASETELERRETTPPPAETTASDDSRQAKIAKRAPAAPALPPPAPVATLPGVAGVQTHQAAFFADNPPPEYPLAALRNRWSGTVLVRIWIDEFGAVTQVKLEESSGYAILDTAALDAVRRWRARAARRGGRPVATVEVAQVNFLPQPS